MSVGGRKADLYGHMSAVAVSDAYQQLLAWRDFSNSRITKRFHMQKNIAVKSAADQKSIAFRAIEPFYLGIGKRRIFVDDVQGLACAAFV